MLFVSPPKISVDEYEPFVGRVKVAGIRLSSSPSQWSDEILQLAIKEHPYLPYNRMVVNFRRKDDTAGYAVGSISFVDFPNVEIPFVVKKNELSPIDVFIIKSGASAGDDTVYPLTPSLFAAHTEHVALGEPVADKDVKGVGYTEDGFNLRLPFRGRTVVASAAAFSSIGASTAKKAEFERLLRDPQIVAGFMVNKSGSVVDAWLQAKEPVGHRVKIASLAPKPAYVVVGAPKDVSISDMFVGRILDDDGRVRVAMKLDTIDLARPGRTPSPIIVYDDGSFTMLQDGHQGKVASVGEVTERSVIDSIVAKISSSTLRRGSNVSFFVDGICTAPVKIASICVHEHEKVVELEAHDYMQRQCRILLDRRVKTAACMADAWVIPMHCVTFVLGDFVAPPMRVEKVAEWFEKHAPDRASVSNGQYSVTVRGRPLASNVRRQKVAELLRPWISNTEELLEAVDRHGDVRFVSSVVELEKHAHQIASNMARLPELAKRIVASFGMPLESAMKLASNIADPDSVDAVLSLGFLSEENLSEFLDLAPRLDEVIQKLSKLLLAIRLGMPGDEVSVSLALRALLKVKEQLEIAMSSLSDYTALHAAG